MLVITDLEDFLKKEEKRAAWSDSNYIAHLIEEGDLEVVSFIEKKCLSRYGVGLEDLNSRLSVNSKKKLQMMLLIHRPEFLERLLSMKFSFKKAFKN